MGVETIALATLITAAAAGGYSAYQSYQMGQEMKKQAGQAQNQANQLQQQEQANTTQAAMLMQKRRAAIGNADTTLRDTILTGPAGLGNTAQPGQKTLLGQ